jgi:hypothetical protein
VLADFVAEFTSITEERPPKDEFMDNLCGWFSHKEKRQSRNSNKHS